MIYLIAPIDLNFTYSQMILISDKNLKLLKTIVSAELCNIYDWLIPNKLPLNIKTSKFVETKKAESANKFKNI